jgi:antitoxin (DNA-binding transcriptional repressor) of toxin-antitoxin stability system
MRRTTTVRELKHETSKVLSWVARGETVEVRRRRRPVARLSPPERPTTVRRPDFLARLKGAYGSKRLRTTGTSVVSESRGES